MDSWPAKGSNWVLKTKATTGPVSDTGMAVPSAAMMVLAPVPFSRGSGKESWMAVNSLVPPMPLRAAPAHTGKSWPAMTALRTACCNSSVAISSPSR